MIDVLVAGGGPAGLATAVNAALAGMSVVVVEPRASPVDKACGEGLMPTGVAALHALGVHPAGHPLRGIRYLDPHRHADAPFRAGPGLGVRRTCLHAALTARAAALGVRVVQGKVTGVRQGPDSVEAQVRTLRTTLPRGTAAMDGTQGRNIAEILVDAGTIGTSSTIGTAVTTGIDARTIGTASTIDVDARTVGNASTVGGNASTVDNASTTDHVTADNASTTGNATTDNASTTDNTSTMDNAKTMGDAETETFRARWLVAADGLRSPLRDMLGLGLPEGAAARRYGLRRHYRVAPWTDFVEVHWAARSEAYVTPVADDLVGVAVLGSERRTYDEHLSAFPALLARLTGPAATSVRGAGPMRRRVRSRVSGRVLLVGDAAGYLDALTGEGVSLALLSAEALVAALRAGHPESYDRAWLRLSRTHRLLTGALLAARRHPAPARLIVPGARALPRVFSAAVNALA
ncbi:FAD-dependent monooxygenase [Sphaerisporangium sp. B11E5]|uniref:NAD(P)/FAD-dependent oxidoreductase n=1 Tax=Sphaerisporangium sp. B11E5 TaxID=3153563 RepID=UPI00325EAF68